MIVPFQPALRALDLLLGYRDPWMPVAVREEGRERHVWHRCGAPGALVTLVQRYDELYSREMLLGIPEHDRGRGPMGASILWARVEGEDQLLRARGFRPLPSMAVAEGSSTRRWLIWGLDRWLPYFDVEERNRKIAYALGAVQRVGSPEHFWLPAPGTCLRVGRNRPAPAVVRRLVAAVFAPDRITRRLKSPPEPQWMDDSGSA